MSDEQLKAELLAAVNAARNVPPHRFQKPLEVQPGQVRQLIAYDNDSDSMLVLVLSVDEISATAKIAGVSSPAFDATHRDLVVDRLVSDLPFELLIRSDGPATAWCVQLAATPQVGMVNRSIVELAASAPRLTNEQLASAAADIGIAVGRLRPRVGDHLWWSVGRASNNLARLTAECHEAMVSEPVADPAILPSLVLRGDDSDKSAAIAMGDALTMELIEESPETWAALDEALSATSARDQDTMRLLERHFLERILKGTNTIGTLGEKISNPELADVKAIRELPAGLNRDPLLELLDRSARAGNRSTRIWTAHHLWTEASAVVHTVIGQHKHAVIGEYEIDAEEVLV
jgi:hypothetical protein